MIVAPTHARVAFAEGRLDANYHCSPGVQANERILMLDASGVELRKVAGDSGIGKVAPTSRTRRIYAAEGEESVPYLRPYDVFDYVPKPAGELSVSANPDVDRLQPDVGTILQTCSGRNLGPSAYADEYINRFAVSDDMLRLTIEDERFRLYVLAYLGTPTGQALLTRSKTGNVIDHLSADDLGAVSVPLFDDEIVDEVAALMRRSVALREQARIGLDGLVTHFEASMPNPTRQGRLADGWTHHASQLFGRLDVAFHDPLVEEARSAIRDRGGVPVSDVAETFIPGRYKRYYVKPEYGKPIVSGRQLLQAKPVNLRHIAPRSFDFSKYALEAGMIAFGAEGRAEERLSYPALITEDREGWLANNHVMRVRPREGVNPGWLYLCFASSQVQAQVKASACGSVVDAVTPTDLNKVMLPPVNEDMGDQAFQYWKDLDAANSLEAEAQRLVEEQIMEQSGMTAPLPL